MTERPTREGLAATIAAAEAVTAPYRTFDYFCRSCGAGGPEHHTVLCAVPLVERLVAHIRALEAEMSFTRQEVNSAYHWLQCGDSDGAEYVLYELSARLARYTRKEAQG